MLVQQVLELRTILRLMEKIHLLQLYQIFWIKFVLIVVMYGMIQHKQILVPFMQLREQFHTQQLLPHLLIQSCIRVLIMLQSCPLNKMKNNDVPIINPFGTFYIIIGGNDV